MQVSDDFSWHPDPFMRVEGPIAIKVINEIPGGWDMLKNFNGRSFIWHATPQIENMINMINSASGNNHSGASLGFLMRHMETIAKNGWDDYVSNIS